MSIALVSEKKRRNPVFSPPKFESGGKKVLVFDDINYETRLFTDKEYLTEYLFSFSPLLINKIVVDAVRVFTERYFQNTFRWDPNWFDEHWGYPCAAADLYWSKAFGLSGTNIPTVIRTIVDCREASPKITSEGIRNFTIANIRVQDPTSKIKGVGIYVGSWAEGREDFRERLTPLIYVSKKKISTDDFHYMKFADGVKRDYTFFTHGDYSTVTLPGGEVIVSNVNNPLFLDDLKEKLKGRGIYDTDYRPPKKF